MIITTSWDDGSKFDLKLLNLLNKYHLKGTFYIPQNYHLKGLSEREIKLISQKHEIGAHTLNHLNLTELNLTKIKQEVQDSKDYLNKILNKQIKMFCYPGGYYNAAVKDIVKSTGFIGARTTQEFCHQLPKDFFELGTTLHIYPFPMRKRDSAHYHLSKALFQPLQRKFWSMLKLKLPLTAFLSWAGLAKKLFDYVSNKDGIFHLWGHTWEIERYNMWEDLEKIFKYISQRDKARYLTNSEILEINL